MILSSLATCYLALLAGLPVEGNLVEDTLPILSYSFETRQDQDFDDLPDDWSRRKGPGYPQYVDVRIDRNLGHSGQQSLHFAVNGGHATIYSPPEKIDADHAYVFRGYVKTQRLLHDAALISISFLDHKRQRVQHFVSQPVSGTHKDWVEVTLGPLTPQANVRFIVLGCHVAHNDQKDISGDIWFDDLWVGSLPQLDILNNYHRHFVDHSAEIRVSSRISGLNPDNQYRLDLELVDNSNRHIADSSLALVTKPEDLKAVEHSRLLDGNNHTEVWRLQPMEYGFYEVRSKLIRDQKSILEKKTTFAVIDLVNPRATGEFGWTISEESENLAVKELPEIAAQAGINWIKYPLWNVMESDDIHRTSQVAEMLDQFTNRGITPVGLLNHPPKKLRSQFAKDWLGVSGIFTMPSSFWSPSLEEVFARYTSLVNYWQLGGDDDNSFIGLQNLNETLKKVKSQLDLIGRDTHVGIHWDWKTPLPTDSMPQSFVSINNAERLSAVELARELQNARLSPGGSPRWVTLTPLPKDEYSAEARGIDLAKRMVTAKYLGADVIFASSVFHEQHGLLNRNGSPTLLFLPWRTVAIALQGARYQGAFNMPNKSTNHVFMRDDEAIVVVWNDEPTEEVIYLGEDVVATDIWGRRISLERDANTHRHTLRVGSSPMILRKCNQQIANWRLAAQFEIGKSRSEYGGHPDAVLGKNTFLQSVRGKAVLNVPRGWEVEPQEWVFDTGAGEKYRLETFMTLPSNASLGRKDVSIDFDIFAERKYSIRVHRPYHVGLGDIMVQVNDKKLKGNVLEIEQVIVNNTSPLETLQFRCSLFIPNMKRMQRFITELKHGQDRKLYYIPNADALKGKELWLRAEQVNGRRILNYRWTVGENWDKPDTISRKQRRTENAISVR
ncbi:hypothetical protein [Gimesia maris]|uniref:Carbohydrate-binding domain-containing protein n=1 Tax=Gimesia maris TaxID=122 RepID=A0ABX5YFW0_9PLAN|nr:hypothetical protein [Gimesia maris]EDL58556.1 hypothetical protein PM8797T_06997 [Gimesia maris DSM 8797]QEG14603.1 hypothetical protein GmarT_04390 [Gimesia maris]QGQ31985.1 hypothetical protein F1729_26980 [Gimesia maris]